MRTNRHYQPSNGTSTEDAKDRHLIGTPANAQITARGYAWRTTYGTKEGAETMQEQTELRRREQIVAGVKRLTPIAVNAVGARHPMLGTFGRFGLSFLEDSTSNAEARGGPASSDQRETRQNQNGNDGSDPPQSGRSVTRGTLSGPFAAANIGGFGYTLGQSNHNLQLSVRKSGDSSNSIGGLFHIENVPPSTWIRLEDRQGRLLPVWVLVEEPNVEITVGDGPSNAPIRRPVDR